MGTLNWYVLTGGPGTGKTTLIAELQKSGYHVVPEAARLYIEKRLARDKTIEQIRGDEVAFQRALFSMKKDAHTRAPKSGPVFFDRGMHDSEAYLRAQGVTHDPELQKILDTITYKKVFLLDPLQYEPDTVRTETKERASAIQTLLREVYTEAGLPIVQVPVLPPEARAEFILTHL